LIRIALSGAVMYAVASFGVFLLGEGSGTLSYAFTLALVGAASVAAYLGAAALLGVEELRSAIALLRRRLPSSE
ncbi:MAG: hypothetical protein L0G70_06170, partial [Rubrobacter sp.]|nr:hypothetical protein [Rubrobacter sp.]